MGSLKIWSGRATYVLIAAVAMVLALLPSDAIPRRWPVPDLMVLVTLAWCLRRPQDVPFWLVTAVFLTQDLVLGRAPGLVTVMMILATEFLRTRHARIAAEGFAAEWTRAAALILAIGAGERMILAITLAETPALGPAVLRALTGAALYPVAVATLIWGIGVRRPARRSDGFGGTA